MSKNRVLIRIIKRVMTVIFQKSDVCLKIKMKSNHRDSVRMNNKMNFGMILKTESSHFLNNKI